MRKPDKLRIVLSLAKELVHGLLRAAPAGGDGAPATLLEESTVPSAKEREVLRAQLAVVVVGIKSGAITHAAKLVDEGLGKVQPKNVSKASKAKASKAKASTTKKKKGKKKRSAPAAAAVESKASKKRTKA